MQRITAKTELINAIQALEILRLYFPGQKAKPNTRYLTKLVRQGYLTRVRGINGKVYLYLKKRMRGGV